MSDPWGGKLERLSLTRRHYHNYDYLRFLVESVWKLHCPTRLVDFGCGSGYLGVKLLPLMPEGSTFQAERFAASGRDFHIVSPLAMMFSFGRVP
jgi:hypothetical protein